MSFRFSRFLFLTSFSIVAACGGATVHDDAPETAGGLHQAPRDPGLDPEPVPEKPTEPGLEPEPVPAKPDATLAVLEARCEDETHGPRVDYASFAELKTKLVGRWFSCDHVAGAKTFYTREAAIEFRADGTWRFLRETADGTFEALTGVENEGTWGEKYTGFTGYFQVNHPDGPNGMVLSEFLFESAPQRLRAKGYEEAPAWLVPMAAE